MAEVGRADYGASEVPGLGAWIELVEKGSPAARAGLEPGMRVDAVNGAELTDLIAWRWEADGSYAELLVYDPQEDGLFEVELEREPGEDWGIDFTDVIFDGVRTCVNACTFCFMSMLPAHMRASLSLRDDDYRLSFLQGNFVTLTNVGDEDLERIIECHLSPMNVSLHAISDDVRRSLIGAHAKRGVEVLERLLDAGIEVHGQIVLCPGINDGDELIKTLDWVEARPLITSLALVPVGYTRHTKRFTSSYSDDADAARSVVRIVEAYQERSRKRDGLTRFQLSDEFYIAADLELPPAESYDGYPQFYDGIGMLRAFMDEAALLHSTRTDDFMRLDSILENRDLRAQLVCGEAADKTIAAFAKLLSPEGRVQTKPIRNDFFGGDVNVTGLIVAKDLLEQLPSKLEGTVLLLPEVMLNFDRITLDGVTEADILAELRSRGATAAFCMPNPCDYLNALQNLLS